MGMRYLLLILVLLVSVTANTQTPVYKLLRGKVRLYDTFTDANSTDLATAHLMNKGQGTSIPWGWTTQPSGLCGGTIGISIQSNTAQPPVQLLPLVTANAGASNVVMTADLIIPNSNNYLGCLVFRWVDCANYWLIGIERDGGGTPYMVIIDCVSGTRTYRASVNVPGATNSTVGIKLTLLGSSIIALASTGETCNYTSSFSETSVHFGLSGYDDGSTYTPSPAIDNFLVVKN